MYNFHIAHIRLKQLEIEPTRRKQRRQREIQLGIRQILPRALATAPAERDEVFAQRGLFQEALRSKGARLWEEVRVVVQEDRCHAYRRHGGNGVAVVFEHRIREETLQTMGGAVIEAEAFRYNGPQIGKLFELLPFWRWAGL